MNFTMQKFRPRKVKASSVAEFGPAVMILFLVFIFPLIDFIGVITGYATVEFMTRDVASQVAKTLDFSQNAGTGSATNTAIQVLYNRTIQLNNSGFASFAKAIPQAGYNNCGMDLYINQIPSTGAVSTVTSSANQPWTSGNIDPNNYLYQYEVKSYYNIGPLISMAGFPLLNKIPGIGLPIYFTSKSVMTVEHPEGLDNGNNYVNNNGMTAGMQSQGSSPGNSGT